MAPAARTRERERRERALATSTLIWRADQPKPQVELALYNQPPPSVGPFPNVGDLLPAFCLPVQPALLGFPG